MIQSAVQIPQDLIEDFCIRNHVTSLALFGSVLRDDFGPESDVDVVVEFHPDHVPGLAFFSMQSELSSLLGRKVDLHTPAELNRYLKKVAQQAHVVYDSA